jgi:hypothetical protein
MIHVVNLEIKYTEQQFSVVTYSKNQSKNLEVEVKTKKEAEYFERTLFIVLYTLVYISHTFNILTVSNKHRN